MQIKKSPFPYSFTLGLILLGFGITQMAYFIISISLHLDLWWTVVTTIPPSDLNLVLAYIMFAVGLVLMASGIILTVTKDRKI